MSACDLVSSSTQVKRQECDTSRPECVPEHPGKCRPAVVWTPERVRELITLVNQEPFLSNAEIGQWLGVASHSVRDKLHNLGITRARRPSITWTPERVEKLEELFAEGVPTAEIGRRLGLTKNTIIGKLHRLALAGCPQTPYEPPHDVFNGGGCLWSEPDSHPGDTDFRFCGADLKPGQRKPYCAEHLAIVYRKPEEDQVDA